LSPRTLDLQAALAPLQAGEHRVFPPIPGENTVLLRLRVIAAARRLWGEGNLRTMQERDCEGVMCVRIWRLPPIRPRYWKRDGWKPPG
jgi:hypothetical protein